MRERECGCGWRVSAWACKCSGRACACAYVSLRAGLSDFGDSESSAHKNALHGQNLLASRQKIFNT